MKVIFKPKYVSCVNSFDFLSNISLLLTKAVILC